MSDLELQVTGGAGGTDAHMDDLRTLSQDSDDLGFAFAAISAECHGVLLDGDLLASAVLNPSGVAKVEKALLGALDGCGGLTWLAAEFGEEAVRLRATAASYEAVESAQAQMMDTIRWTAGAAFGASLPLTWPGLVGLGLAAGLSPEDAERFLVEHPGIVDNVTGGSGGFLSIFGIPAGDVSSAAHLTGMLYPDGQPAVHDSPWDFGDADNPAVLRTPQGFADLISELDFRNQRSSQSQDLIEVRAVVAPDGTKSYVVHIPGTKEINTPISFTSSLNDMGTNMRVLGGDVTSRERALAMALEEAKVPRGAPVMLVGHSQGGMLAAQAAHDSALGDRGPFPYNVTHVVTAGSPIARADVPEHIQVLALENRSDIVPHLDARENPDRSNFVTVKSTIQHGTVGGNHGTTDSYISLAGAVDDSQDPSVAAFRRSASNFLGPQNTGSAVDAQVLRLERTR